MEHPFEMWSDRIAAAQSDDARRSLLGEAMSFRARHLGDVASMRRATFVVSRLQQLLGEHDRAVHEARQLLSLCQTTPVASGEELDAARRHLSGLGESVPRIVSPPRERSWKDRPPRERRERPERPDRPARPAKPAVAEPGRGSGLQAARDAASAGRWNDALRHLGKGAGPMAQLLRTWVQLSRALEDEGDVRDRVGKVRDELGRVVGVSRQAAVPERPAATDPLSVLLGAPAPEKRAPRLRMVDAWAEAHPERIDELAAAVLRHHLQVVGARIPAPWLVGTVARAMATGAAPLTEAALGELRAADAVAAQAYDEWPFDRVVRLVGRALQRGLHVSGIRRGVAAGSEPDDRKVWTLRLRDDAGERLVAVAPHAADPYADGKAEDIGARVCALCTSALLLASGSGNDALRAAAEAAGASVMDRDADDDRILDATLALPPVAVASRVKAEPAPPAATPAPAAEAAPPRPPRVSDLLSADPLDVDALREAVSSSKRPERALRAVRGPLPDEHLAALLGAVAAACVDDRAIPEGTTLALRSGGAASRSILLSAPQYGGPGVAEVAAIADALRGAGWDLHRVLRGPTHRERTQHPALDTLGEGLAGVWRLLVRRGDQRGEVWYVHELSPEGRAGVPLLLLEDWQRAIVLRDDADLRSWWDTLGREALTWNADGEPLLAVVDAFTVSTAPSDGGSSDAEGADAAP
ncbi:MAG: hypothetical protein H6735_09965 [Alphaproteobacteria bacterium]|nr:hypothetical protein [Alphaproteobacteria bacterium]